MPDIDIDFANRDLMLSKIKHRIAKLDNGKKHNTGIYVNEIPYNPIDNIATLTYRQAEERGYFKLDFLNVSIYNQIENDEELNELINKEPIWELLEHKEFVDKLFHLAGHSNVCKKLKPKSVEDLAAVLAIIRPAKRHLIEKDWNTIRKEIWIKPSDGSYYYKKAHAVSYALAVVVHMNLLCKKLISSGS